jgi:hypothetical protein
MKFETQILILDDKHIYTKIFKILLYILLLCEMQLI